MDSQHVERLVSAFERIADALERVAYAAEQGDDQGEEHDAPGLTLDGQPAGVPREKGTPL